MNVQAKAFQVSFLIHALLIATVVALGSFFKSPPKMMVINFDLEPAPVGDRQAAPKPGPARKAATLRKENPLVKTRAFPKESPLPTPTAPAAKESLPEPPPAVTSLPSEQAAPIFSPPSKAQTPAETNPGFTGTAGNGGGSVLAAGTGGGPAPGNSKIGGQGSGSGEDKLQNKYLREHFSYIRDKILRNIRYPAMARRMGWQGRVLLSFIISLDGSIKETRIMQGSGFEVLDKSAVETVKETAPFPKPPAEAKLVIPITYRLE